MTPVQGYSFGLNHQPDKLTALSIQSLSGLSTHSPDFVNQGGVNTGSNTGAYASVVIDFQGQQRLPPGDHDLHGIWCLVNMYNGSSATACFCDCIAPGAVVNTFVVVNGTDVQPTEACGTVSAIEPTWFSLTPGDGGVVWWTVRGRT